MAVRNTHFNNGQTFGPQKLGSQRGRQIQWYQGAGWVSFVPATLDRDGICASQTPGGAGALTMNGALVTGGVGIMDVPRSVSIYGTGNETGKNFTITGIDEYGQTMSEVIAGPNNTTVNTLKAFYRVTAVSVDAATAAAVEIGSGDKFGLPFKLLDVPIPRWAGTLAQDAGTYVAAVTTDPATTTTGDVRGTYLPSSASNGSRRLTLHGLIPIDFDSVNRVDWLGVTQA